MMTWTVTLTASGGLPMATLSERLEWADKQIQDRAMRPPSCRTKCLLYIAERDEGAGVVTSSRLVSQDLSLNRSTVIQCLKSLTDLGLVRRDYVDGLRSRFSLIMGQRQASTLIGSGLEGLAPSAASRLLAPQNPQIASQRVLSDLPPAAGPLQGPTANPGVTRLFSEKNRCGDLAPGGDVHQLFAGLGIQCCSRCIYFAPGNDLSVDAGECHLKGPKLDPKGSGAGVWPEVHAQDFCGAFVEQSN